MQDRIDENKIVNTNVSVLLASNGSVVPLLNLFQSSFNMYEKQFNVYEKQFSV